MVIDIPSEIISESVRRQVNQVMDEVVVKEVPDCPVWNALSSEQMKRFAALNIVMARIIRSTYLN